MSRETRFNTYSVEPLGATTPTVIAKAMNASMRVQVSNVGPVLLFIADDVTHLVPEPDTETYRIIPGEQHVFVLDAKQSLYAIGAGTGGIASISSSPAQVGERSVG